MTHTPGLRKTETGKAIVRIEDGDGTNRTLAEAKIVGGRVEQDAFRLAQVGSRFPALREISTADQQR